MKFYYVGSQVERVHSQLFCRIGAHVRCCVTKWSLYHDDDKIEEEEDCVVLLTISISTQNTLLS